MIGTVQFGCSCSVRKYEFERTRNQRVRTPMISVNPGVHRMLLVVVDQLKSHSPACWISGVNLNQYLPIKNGGSAQPMAMLSIFWLVGWLVGGVHLECFHANSVSTWRMYAHTRTGFGLWASLAIAQTQLSFVLSQRKILQSAGLTPVQWSRVYSASSLARTRPCMHPSRHNQTLANH